MKLIPPVYLFVFIILALVVYFIIPVGKMWGAPVSYLGILFILFGLGINGWTAWLYKKYQTNIKTDARPSKFIKAGPFRYSRNPIYSGMTAILLGVAILLGTVLSFIFPLAFILVMRSVFIPTEEKNMEKSFGADYLNYKQQVRRWV